MFIPSVLMASLTTDRFLPADAARKLHPESALLHRQGRVVLGVEARGTSWRYPGEASYVCASDVVAVAAKEGKRLLDKSLYPDLQI